MRDVIVAFGEVMARLSPERGDPLGTAKTLSMYYGGAEANVAVAAAQLGGKSALVTTAPDNALGRGMAAAMRSKGVDVTGVRFVANERMGLYFATPAAGIAPTEVLYDRALSAFALHPDPLDVSAALKNAAFLHISGITPALSRPATDAALSFARAATEASVEVSFDGNYRARLWEAWGGGAAALSILRQLLALASVAFLNHRDVALLLDLTFDGEEPSARNALAYQAAFSAFPRLRLICSTERTVENVGCHRLGACAMERGGVFLRRPELTISPVIDRIGGGDAFAGAMLLALMRQQALEEALRLALYAAAAKHGQLGDALTLSQSALLDLAASTVTDVNR